MIPIVITPDMPRWAVELMAVILTVGLAVVLGWMFVSWLLDLVRRHR